MVPPRRVGRVVGLASLGPAQCRARSPSSTADPRSRGNFGVSAVGDFAHGAFGDRRMAASTASIEPVDKR